MPHSLDNRPKRLTVAHVVEGCQGGVGTAVRLLIDAQMRDPAIGSVHLFADPARLGDMLLETPATLHAYASSRKPWRLAGVASQLTRQLAVIEPDVVFLHSTFPGVYGRMFRPAGRQWATVYCAHGWAFTQRVSALHKLVYRAAERLLARRSDVIVSISFSEFEEASAAGIAPPIHRVIHHGLPAASAGWPAPLPVNPARINIGFIGRFDRQKGLDVLLAAFGPEGIPGIDLWLIGDSTLDEAPSIPDCPAIHALGWVPNDEIDAHIRCFDALVAPSRWEGFGLVALEAMRNHKPVIASRVGGLAELVIDRVNGRLFDADATEDLRNILLGLSKPELQRMGDMGRAVYESAFQWEQCYTRWRGVMMEALSGCAARQRTASPQNWPIPAREPQAV